MPASDASSSRPWWKRACIYQIYPASFKDSNGDGIGDLRGILDKLDYIKSLGVDAVWISPFFESPDFDMGYDISDYRKPSAHYGKLEDVDAIIKGCRDRGLKILFDLVVNHTSHLHRWFIESEKSKDSPYRKYYHWKPGKKDADRNRIPPTNWRGAFGGSTWEYSEKTDEYYLHLFTPQQPDLNWEIPEVRQAIYDEAITFWLDRGLDGFRVDTSALYSKHPFDDVTIVDPHNHDQPAGHVHEFGPNLDTYLQEMNKATFAKYGAVTLAEIGARESGTALMLNYVSAAQKKYDMAIRFDLVYLDHGEEYYLYAREVELPKLKSIIALEQELADPKVGDGWLVNYLENHDQARSVSRYADDSPEYRVQSAKMLAIYLSTISGTLLLYEGQEIGFINCPKSWPIEEYPDPMTVMFWAQIQKDLKAGKEGYTMEGAMAGVQKVARDHARTPMHWDSTAQAGFTTANKTWMRVMDSYTSINVADQEKEPKSVLNFWRKMLAMRKEREETFIFATFHLLDPDNKKTMSYLKKALDGSGEIVYVILNWCGEESEFSLPQDIAGEPHLLANSYDDGAADGSTLRPWEARVYAFKA